MSFYREEYNLLKFAPWAIAGPQRSKANSPLNKSQM
jgi:hypothetical protein